MKISCWNTKLEELKQEYGHIREQLEELSKARYIDEYTKCTLIDMSGKVLEHIANNYQNVKEGVKSVMGGKVLEYEAKTIRNEFHKVARRDFHKEE